MPIRFGQGVREKVQDLSTLIQESQFLEEPGQMPESKLTGEAHRSQELQFEVDTALAGLKEIAEKLVQMKSLNPELLAFARRIVVYRRAMKLLAREHYVTKPGQSGK